MDTTTERDDSNFLEFLHFNRIAQATRFAIGCVVIGISLLAILTSLGIDRQESMLEDMIGSRDKLPDLTKLVMGTSGVFVLVSFAIPVCCIFLMLSRNMVRSLYLLGGLALVSIVEAIVIYVAMSVPLMTVLQQVGR
jgi:hypothetical protein